MPHIRLGAAGDLPELTAIYNHYVTRSHATFDLEEFDVDQRRTWFDHYRAEGPHRLLVATDEDGVAGYCTSSEFRAKAAYRTSVETTIYLRPGAVGRGLGRALYADLLAHCDRSGIHRCYAAIAMPNDASEALHRSLGFEPVGTYGEVGFKFGRFIDVTWFERRGLTDAAGSG